MILSCNFDISFLPVLDQQSKVANEGKIVISLDFSYGFDADLIFHSILISKSKQVNLSQDKLVLTRGLPKTKMRQTGDEKRALLSRLLFGSFLAATGERS